MIKTELTLVLPNMSTILRQKINNSVLPESMVKILNKSHFQSDLAGLSRTLLDYFSAIPLSGTDLPIASLELNTHQGLRADPCYLYADRDRLLLFQNNNDVSKEDSLSLISEIQPLLDEVGGHLSLSESGHWLLRLKTMPELSFTALEDVVGKGVQDYLPKGKEQQRWICLWNEIQMVLYSSDVNQRRVNEGKLPINSIWFWGTGDFDLQQQKWQSVQGSSWLLEQLAQKSGCDIDNSRSTPVSSLSVGKHLWLLDSLDNENDWVEQLKAIDDEILKPVWQYCKQGKINRVTLHIPEHGYYQFNTLDCWKFWK